MYQYQHMPTGTSQSYSYYSDNYNTGMDLRQSYPSSTPQSQSQIQNYYFSDQQIPFDSSLQTMNSPQQQHYPTSDPRLMAQQTNLTLTALASARLSPEYIKETSQLASFTRDNVLNSRPTNESYHDVHSSHYYPGYGGSPDAYGLRPAYNQGYQSPIANPTQSSNSHPKIAEGHACAYCGKAFGRPSALKIHLAIHTGEKAFVCPEPGCHRSFSVRSNMSRHVRNVHQIWPEGNDQESGDEDIKKH